jgi:hypothetical protein
MSRLKTIGLFNTFDKVDDAFQYVDKIVGTLQGSDKIAAYTAVYVLYNSVVNHYNKDDAYVIEFTGKNIEKEFGHLFKKEEVTK